LQDGVFEDCSQDRGQLEDKKRLALALASTNLSTTPATGVTLRVAVLKYLDIVQQRASTGTTQDPWLQPKSESSVQILQPLLEKVLSVPATSASV